MNTNKTFEINPDIYLKDPQDSVLGRNILVQGALMINELGYEEFTLRKLAVKLATTESSIYRYFENKHRLLLYLVSWYWRWLEYQIKEVDKHYTNQDQKIHQLLELLLLRTQQSNYAEFSIKLLHQIVIKEGAKIYLTHHVNQDNEKKFFKPYKDVCKCVSDILLQINPNYKYARALTSTVLEMSHYQLFFMNHLPSLTDFGVSKDSNEVVFFLKDLIFKSLKE